MPVPSPPYLILKKPHPKERGQSLVEFAVSSVVLLLLVGGLVDIGRSVFVQETLSNAVREGARHGAWYDAPSLSHPYLYDNQIKGSVDAELAAISLPASVLKNPGNTCPTSTDGNAYHNPPYTSASYPPTANQPWLYICYANTPGLDYTSPATNMGQLDLNVIVLYTYGPLTPLVKSQFGVFQLAVNQHMTVQGP
ncbi:MAG TPA: TadE/TadG family type IV pilus assembly protein [Candidatus Limnocylindrales bacterium]|nr:TadE/TadG family type IV pilus assembly protein [Candidatus Limnocylindrales bacterium]